MISYDPFIDKREEMVEKQLRRRGIKNSGVLAAMSKIPRHLFVGKALQDHSYEDGPLPISEKQTISQPYIVALMSEALNLSGKEKVLEIGSGSGYQTAVLSMLADRVFSIERLPKLGRETEKRLFDMGYHNVLIRIADGTYGWPEEAPYNGIIVTAASPSVPDMLVTQLAPEGRLVIPIGTETEQSLLLFTKTKEGLKETHLCACRFVKLIGRYGWDIKKLS